MAPRHARPVLALSVAVAATTLLGCGRVEVDDAAPPSTTSVVTTAAAVAAPSTPAPAPAPGGPTFTATDGRFSAKFPTAPERVEQSGGGVTFVVYGAVKDGRYVSITFVDYPKGTANLGDQRAMLRQKTEDEGMLSVNDATFLGRPAVDVVVRKVEDGATLFRHERAFLVGNRMYFLRGESASPTAPAEYATLLAGFKLT